VAPIEKVSRTYRFAMAACTPAVRWWGRLEVDGLEHLHPEGPVLLAGNHDSHWDPVAVGIAGVRRRQIRALAKASMWKRPGLRHVLDGMGQIPIQRGAGDAGALSAATAELRAGACIGIFPEGTLSRGTVLRARSGIGRLAQDVPEAQIICCSVTGTTDLARGPRVRPRIRIRFFPPAGGGLQPGEAPTAFAQRLLDEIRAEAPRVAAGRKAGR
jgi:1-acyl-sn-glycerol-3-phosphate acyltransferase